jgi:feruloyl-CoA synthase
MYLDDGKPMPAGVETTIANLREIAPSVYFNVPKGYEELLPYLRAEPALRRTFFSRLKLMFYAGAGLSQHVWTALQELAVEACGERIVMVTGLGATETAPMAINATWPGDQPGQIGLPVPGVDIKLVPAGGKLEVRAQGPSVTPGYWRQEAITRAAFDAEGFYCMGDAVRMVDPQDLGQGFAFDGRIAEDFKLATGTWVSVGPLRGRVIAECAPLVRDVVIAGHDRDDVGVLIVPDEPACRALCPARADAPLAAVLAEPAVRARFATLLAALAHEATGSASRVARAILMWEPLSLDAGEVTDKGSLNQRAILARRASLLDELYASPPGTRVIVVGAR